MSEQIPTVDLDTPYPITDEQIAQYQRDGFIRLKGVFSADELAAYEDVITEYVMNHKMAKIPFEDRNEYSKSFIQVMNIWEECPQARPFFFNQRLARIATELMGRRGVRMYHDQALFKDPSGHRTPWHADQSYWPLATEWSTTAWVPFQAVPLEMGPLSFAVGSHRKLTKAHRMKISPDSQQTIEQHVTLNDLPISNEPFELGDVSFHYGWTFHRANPNTTDRMRKVQTMIYMDMDMELYVDGREGDAKRWCPGIKEGELIDSPLNPILYQRDAQ